MNLHSKFKILMLAEVLKIYYTKMKSLCSVVNNNKIFDTEVLRCCIEIILHDSHRFPSNIK